MAPLLHRLRPPRAAPAPVEDARLVVLARADQEAFAALYERYFAGIYGYCYRRLGSVEQAEDATQQVFEQALVALPRYRERGRFRSWLFAIAHHMTGAQLGADYRDASLDGVAEPADAGSSPEEQAIGALDRRDLLAAIERLPDDQRRVVELRIAGLRGREIAEAMGRSHEAVRMLQHRALAHLASSLNDPDRSEGGRHGA